MRRWLLSRYLLFWTRRAKNQTRALTDWCDYCLSKRVRFRAQVNGGPFGQSCFRHSGALLADAAHRGSATMIPVNDRRDERNKRLETLVIE